MAQWIWMYFPSQSVISHMVPKCLLRPLLADLASRGHPDAVYRGFPPTDYMDFDLPGVICADRPKEQISLAGLDLRIPCEDVVEMLAKLRTLPERYFANGRRYYKLKGYLRCVVLTANQRQKLEVELANRALSAEQKAELFYADCETPGEVLASASKVARGALGRDRRDRFHEKNRGEA